MKLLIAEDDPDLNKILVKKLRADGFDVENCFNGEEAVDRLQFADYDIVIMDIMMPVMDGIEAVRLIRQQGISTPVIFLTAKDAVSDKVKGLNIGANDYVVKPFSFDELIARINAVTRTAGGNISDVIALDDLSIDIGSHIVKRGDDTIPLGGKEYYLLEYLLMNKNRILSREKILSHVWEYDFEGGENIVDVYVHMLRKKIDLPGMKKLIHNVRGIGYVMRTDE
ncbi:MAG: response regulator transcription factor [Huintestinicola sp.]|uniref:response regulator transcription factor n=1 Tax=Huintestinicola sp. TaxID=2981661 RepID=UPI003F0C7D5D